MDKTKVRELNLSNLLQMVLLVSKGYPKLAFSVIVVALFCFGGAMFFLIMLGGGLW